MMDPRLLRLAHAGDVYDLHMLLIEHPRIYNQQTLTKNTALHIAAKEGHLEFVRKLLQLKPRISSHANIDGNTPLHEAAKQGHSQVVEILLNHKVDANVINTEGVSPLFMAAEEGHLTVVRQLLRVRSPKVKFDQKRHFDGQICVHAAAYRGHLGVVIELLNLRSDMVRIVDKYGATPLHSAIIAGRMEVVREMINRERTLCYKVDKIGRSPLHLAAMKGHVDVVHELVCCVPDCMEFKNKDGKTALHLAVEYEHPGVVSDLLKAHINAINEHDNEGNTVLHSAVIKKFQQMVELLVSSPRLDINAINNQGFTALDIAKNERDHMNMESMIFMEAVLERNGGRQGPGPLTLFGKPSTLESISNLGGTGSLVASLIATVTFDAVLNMPNLFKDSSSPNGSSSSLSLNSNANINEIKFKIFMTSNAMAFFAALNVILIWLFIEPLRLTNMRRMRKMTVLSNVVLGIALLCMGIAFLIVSHMTLFQAQLAGQLSETRGLANILVVGIIFTLIVGPGICVFLFMTEGQKKRKNRSAIPLSIIIALGFFIVFMIILGILTS